MTGFQYAKSNDLTQLNLQSYLESEGFKIDSMTIIDSKKGTDFKFAFITFKTESYADKFVEMC